MILLVLPQAPTQRHTYVGKPQRHKFLRSLQKLETSKRTNDGLLTIGSGGERESKKPRLLAWLRGLFRSGKYRIKLKESEKYLDLARELESDGYTSGNWHALYCHQRIGTDTGRLGNKRTNRDHQNYRLVEIDQNTWKSPGNLRSLAVTQTEKCKIIKEIEKREKLVLPEDLESFEAWVRLFGFYSISAFVRYLTPNPFLGK